jgi:hypothetical protein
MPGPSAPRQRAAAAQAAVEDLLERMNEREKEDRG